MSIFQRVITRCHQFFQKNINILLLKKKLGGNTLKVIQIYTYFQGKYMVRDIVAHLERR